MKKIFTLIAILFLLVTLAQSGSYQLNATFTQLNAPAKAYLVSSCVFREYYPCQYFQAVQ